MCKIMPCLEDMFSSTQYVSITQLIVHILISLFYSNYLGPKKELNSNRAHPERRSILMQQASSPWYDIKAIASNHLSAQLLVFELHWKEIWTERAYQ